MDLAGAPKLPGHSRPARDAAAATGCVRLLSVAQAGDAAFLAQWERLAGEASEPNPFFEPWFALPSFQHFADGNACALLAHYTGGRLTGLLPIVRRTSYYGYPIPHVATWLHDNAFCGGPLVAAGHEAGFWRDSLSYLDAGTRGALFLHLPELPSDGALASALREAVARSRRRSVVVEEATRAMLASDLSPSAYFEASMSAKKRKELRRQHKRLGEEGELAFERVERAEGIDRWIEDFLALEAAGWKGDAGSALASAQDTRGFFAAVLEGAAAAGKLERLSLRLDGQPVAMLANFLSPPGAFSFKTAFDERYARFSPGLLLQIENLDLLTRPDIDWADSCASPGHSMIERIWREKRGFTARNVAIGGPLRRALFRALMAYETRGKAKA